jgi:uncharacterized membrane protein
MQLSYKFINWRFVSLNMFRAPPRPSSGAYTTALTASDLTLERGGSSVVSRCLAGRLLIMGVEAPETCWAKQNVK